MKHLVSAGLVLLIGIVAPGYGASGQAETRLSADQVLQNVASSLAGVETFRNLKEIRIRRLVSRPDVDGERAPSELTDEHYILPSQLELAIERVGQKIAIRIDGDEVLAQFPGNAALAPAPDAQKTAFRSFMWRDLYFILARHFGGGKDSGLSVERGEDTALEGKTYISLTVTPAPGLITSVFYIDPATWRPYMRRIVNRGRTIDSFYRNYSETDHGALPMRVATYGEGELSQYSDYLYVELVSGD